MTVIHINFDGRLIGKGRPRFGKGRVYTPAKTLAAETSLGLEAKVVMHQRKLKMLEGPVKGDYPELDYRAGAQ